jgi:excisionase family DNA binding protein
VTKAPKKAEKPKNLKAATAKTACDVLGVHAQTLRRWAQAGAMASRTVGSQFRYDVAAYLAKRQVKP